MKTTIREILPDSLGDADRSVRTSAAYAVAAVAAFDWPTHWPNLIEALVNAVASTNAPLVHGAMHALSGHTWSFYVQFHIRLIRRLNFFFSLRVLLDLAALVAERQNELQGVLERFSQALFPHLLKIIVTHDDVCFFTSIKCIF